MASPAKKIRWHIKKGVVTPQKLFQVEENLN